MNRQPIYTPAIAISVATFLVALTQKCYCTAHGCSDSGEALLMGAIGFLYGGAAFSWLANPLLLVSWFSVKTKPKVSLICSLLAVLFSISFLFFKTIIADEGGNYTAITGYGMGYGLWVFSSLVMLLANIVLFFPARKIEK